MRIAERDERRRQEMHRAQLKELEDHEKMPKFQEDRAEEDRLHREGKEKTKQRLNKRIVFSSGMVEMTRKHFSLGLRQ